MSFIYPRLVAIGRPKTTANVGDAGYSAQRGPADTNPLFSDLAASIQIDRQGQHNPTGLPTDAQHATVWKVIIDPVASPGPGQIETGDIVTDDAGAAYQVFGPYWNSLGYQLRCTLLEV